jgi:phosphate transport system permease protein
MKGIWRTGDPFIWLTGGALALALLMVLGLVALVMVNGLGFFWPRDVAQLTLTDGRVIAGEIVEREPIPQAAPGATVQPHRIKVKQGNRDLYGADFLWVDEPVIAAIEYPSDLTVLQRREWGTFYGRIVEVRDGARVVARGNAEGWTALQERIPLAQDLFDEIRRIEKHDIGRINLLQERVRLKIRGLELRGAPDGPEVDALRQELGRLQAQYDARVKELDALKARQVSSVVLRAAGDQEKDLPLAQIVRAYRPNAMGVPLKLAMYAGNVWEFVAGEPRESNTEGGVFPAIFGTVLMVFIMSLVVAPFGVLAAFYLREYARQGPFVSAVRVAVNNLAGVPSIVFGVFGLGFFVYAVGGSIDRLFYREALPTPTFGTGGILWASLTLALLTVPVVIVATEEGLAAVPRTTREGSLALGATKLETTLRVVLPAVLPSILTGLILAMARAAGEVAPLMITGVVKLAPALAVDGLPPFLHLERKFMHLGFHIYDVGFQSPNVDAARPMVFATTLLLLGIVLILNVFAIGLRNRLRRRYAGSAV